MHGIEEDPEKGGRSENGLNLKEFGLKSLFSRFAMLMEFLKLRIRALGTGSGTDMQLQ
jgi:hypothetical protein